MSEPTLLQRALIASALEQTKFDCWPDRVLSHPDDTAKIYGQDVADLLRGAGRVDFEDGSFLELVQDEDGVHCRYERP